jgi:RhtB (resistance to homoserine/threonine) family protein
MYLTEFLTIAIAHLFAVASPGPDFAIVLRNSITQGKQAGVWTSLGIALGILLHVTYCVLGIGLLISSSTTLFTIVKLLAAIYLGFLGISAIRSATPLASQAKSTGDGIRSPAQTLVFTGFLTNGLNPKATLFFLALYSVVVDADTPIIVQAGYGIYLSVATFAWFALLSSLLGMASARQFLLKAGHWFERIMGFILIVLGIQLALSVAPL